MSGQNRTHGYPNGYQHGDQWSDRIVGTVNPYGTAPVYETYVEPPPMPWPVSWPVSWPVFTRPRFVSKFSTRKRGAR